MEILSPLFAIILFFVVLFSIKKAYHLFVIYRLRKKLHNAFYENLEFFLIQAVLPYKDVLFVEGDTQEIHKIRNMDWEEIASLCNKEMNPSWYITLDKSVYQGKQICFVLFKKVQCYSAQSHSEVQFQLSVFFEKVIPLMEEMKETLDPLRHMVCVNIVRNLFNNYANIETQAKFEKRILPLIIEEE